MKQLTVIFIFLISFYGFSQDILSNYRTKKVAVKDTIAIDSVSINPNYFLVKTKNNILLDSTFFNVDFPKAILILNKPIETDSIVIDYLKFPAFLTRTYKQLDENVIVENNDNIERLYQLSQPNTPKDFIPFDGLSTSGSISRGVTVGNNQNSVLRS